MKIEQATISDLNDLTQVEIESKKMSIPDCIEDFEIDFQSRADRWQTYFDGKSPQSSFPQKIILKAIQEDKIIGYLAGHFSSRYNLEAEIQSFYVLKEFQRQGIGKALLQKYVEWLLDNERKSLCVGFNPANKYKSFYEKFGGLYLNEHWIYWNDLERLNRNLIEF